MIVHDYGTGGMTQIQSRLYLGTLFDVEQFLKANNPRRITHVLNCTSDGTLAGMMVGQVKALQLDQEDGREFSLRAIFDGLNFIRHSLAQADTKVLVCCHAGVSRSATMMIAFLYTCGMTWDEAKRHVKSLRPIIQPHALIESSFLKAFGLIPSSEKDLIQA